MKRLAPGFYCEPRRINGAEHVGEVFRDVNTGFWYWRLKNSETRKMVFKTHGPFRLMADARQELAKAVILLEAGKDITLLDWPEIQEQAEEAVERLKARLTAA